MAVNGHDGLHLELPAEAENVVRVRRAVEEHAVRWGLTQERIGDLKTVVSEACANVVLYAYDVEDEVSLEIEMTRQDGDVVVLVRDQGAGIRPRPDIDVPSMSFGLALIGALSRKVFLTSEAGVGTALEIHLPAN